jgi:excisionase family DNA binding protein
LTSGKTVRTLSSAHNSGGGCAVKTQETTDRLLSAQEVADYLGVPLTTLYAWRSKNAAPRAMKVGRHLRFKRSDVEGWLNEQADPSRAGVA